MNESAKNKILLEKIDLVAYLKHKHNINLSLREIQIIINKWEGKGYKIFFNNGIYLKSNDEIISLYGIIYQEIDLYKLNN